LPSVVTPLVILRGSSVIFMVVFTNEEMRVIRLSHWIRAGSCRPLLQRKCKIPVMVVSHAGNALLGKGYVSPLDGDERVTVRGHRSSISSMARHHFNEKWALKRRKVLANKSEQTQTKLNEPPFLFCVDIYDRSIRFHSPPERTALCTKEIWEDIKLSRSTKEIW
jgi:hypothetical protein